MIKRKQRNPDQWRTLFTRREIYNEPGGMRIRLTKFHFSTGGHALLPAGLNK